MALVPSSVLVTTSKAPVTTSVALVPSGVLVTTSKAPVTTSVALVPSSFLLLLVRHLLLLAMHLFLVAFLLLLVRHLLLLGRGKTSLRRPVPLSLSGPIAHRSHGPVVVFWTGALLTIA